MSPNYALERTFAARKSLNAALGPAKEEVMAIYTHIKELDLDSFVCEKCRDGFAKVAYTVDGVAGYFVREFDRDALIEQSVDDLTSSIDDVIDGRRVTLQPVGMALS